MNEKIPDIYQTHGTLLCLSSPSPEYHILRFQLPQVSKSNQIAPGTFVQIRDAIWPLMRCRPDQRWIEVLCEGELPTWMIGKENNEFEMRLVCNQHFTLPEDENVLLLLGEDSGIAPIIFLAETLRRKSQYSPLVLLSFNSEIPFRPQPSRIMTPDLPQGVIATIPLLEDWGIPCRIAHANEPPGCYGGSLAELVDDWLKKQARDKPVVLFASGQKHLLDQLATIANRYTLPYQTVET